MKDKNDLAAEMRRRAEAEVERAVGEFVRGEDVGAGEDGVAVTVPN